MIHHGDILDPLAEVFAVLDDHGKYKSVILIVAHLKGRLDVDALESAINRSTDKFPILMSGVREVKLGGRFSLIWELRPHLRPHLKTSELNTSNTSIDMFHSVMDHLKPRLERGLNLFNGVAGEFHLIRVDKHHHIAASILHHAAVDGELGAEIQRFIFAHYHQILTGSVPEWEQSPRSFSTMKKRREHVNRSSRKNEYLKDLRFPWPGSQKHGLPVGSGDLDNEEFHSCRRTLSLEATAQLSKESESIGALLIDRAVGSAHLAIEQWNDERRTWTGMVTTAISVNLRNRFLGIDNPNSLTVLYFKSDAADRKDRHDFFHSLGRERIKQFRNKTDLAFYKFLSNARRALSFFPLRIRRGIFKFLVEKAKWYGAIVHIHYLGVVVPEFANGRPTGNSLVLQAGDLEVTELYGFAYKPAIQTPIHIWLYTYRNRLHMIVVAWGSHFTRDETEAFSDLVFHNLVINPSCS